ncbi:hypothetical protein MMC18_008603 [Xylographa bjoerkii]|nr:hypothetical protein [Xylographa bjoerkii]
MKLPRLNNAASKQHTFSRWQKVYRAVVNWIKQKRKEKPTMTQKKSKKVLKAEEDNQNWTSQDRIFTSKSKLPDVNLHKTLSRPEAWDTLSVEEKVEVSKLLPENVLTDGAPTKELLKYSSDWRESVRLFQGDVRAGHHESEWLAEANEASKERAAGLFDEHKDGEFEAYWGQKQRVDPRAQAGEAVKIVLADLIKANLFATGDQWSYSRSFGRGKSAILVEKECLLLEINGEELKMYIPSGQRKFIGQQTVKNTATARTDTTAASTQVNAAPEEVNDADLAPHNTRNRGKPAAPPADNIIHYRKGKIAVAIRIPEDDDLQASDPDHVPIPTTISITSLVDLERQILAIDGRAPLGVKNDPWRYIRILRHNQDIGALWDLREQEYNRSQQRR